MFSFPLTTKDKGKSTRKATCNACRKNETTGFEVPYLGVVQDGGALVVCETTSISCPPRLVRHCVPDLQGVQERLSVGIRQVSDLSPDCTRLNDDNKLRKILTSKGCARVVASWSASGARQLWSFLRVQDDRLYIYIPHERLEFVASNENSGKRSIAARFVHASSPHEVRRVNIQ